MWLLTLLICLIGGLYVWARSKSAAKSSPSVTKASKSVAAAALAESPSSEAESAESPSSESKESELPACPLSAKPKSKDTIAELFTAVQRSELDPIREWVKAGNSVDATSEGSTLLHSAAVFGSLAVIECLIDELGATVDCKENSNLTPLHLACNEGFEDCAKALLEAGASLHAVNKDSVIRLGGSIPIYSPGGRTPLHFAADRGNDECVKLLLSCPDIKPDAKDNDGQLLPCFPL